jgi:hypothetical protein
MKTGELGQRPQYSAQYGNRRNGVDEHADKQKRTGDDEAPKTDPESPDVNISSYRPVYVVLQCVYG